MKLLTAAQVRAELTRLSERNRAAAFRLLASAFDAGAKAGPGARNPFLVTPTKAKGKAR